MTRSQRILAAVGTALAVTLALAGCVRFQADLSVDDANRLDGDIVVAVITNDEPGSADQARESSAEIETQLLPALRGADGVTAQPYEQDDYVGTRFTLADTPMQALDGGDADGALRLTREGDVFTFTGRLDFTPDDTPDAGTDGTSGTGAPETPADPGDGGIEVRMTFPGEVIEHDGELSGTTVTWSTSLEGAVDMRATASAIPSCPPMWVWLVAAGAALLIVLVTGFVLIRTRRRAAP